MDTFQEYLAHAYKVSGVASGHQFAKLLNVSAGFYWQMKRYGVLPGDDVMVRIANLAHQDPMEALARLNLWRCKPEGQAHDYYRRWLASLTTAATILLSVAVSAPSYAQQAGVSLSTAIHYAIRVRRRLAAAAAALFRKHQPYPA